MLLLLRRPGIDQAPDKRQLIRLLKRPDRSSHAFTLGLCDGLNAKAAVAFLLLGRWLVASASSRPRFPRSEVERRSLHGQTAEAPHHVALETCCTFAKRVIRHPSQYALQKHPGFQAGEWRPYAVMDPLAKGDIALSVTLDIERVGVLEATLIAVGCPVQDEDIRSRWSVHPGERSVHGGNALGYLQRGVKAQHFLDRGRDVIEVAA